MVITLYSRHWCSLEDEKRDREQGGWREKQTNDLSIGSSYLFIKASKIFLSIEKSNKIVKNTRLLPELCWAIRPNFIPDLRFVWWKKLNMYQPRDTKQDDRQWFQHKLHLLKESREEAAQGRDSGPRRESSCEPEHWTKEMKAAFLGVACMWWGVDWVTVLTALRKGRCESLRECCWCNSWMQKWRLEITCS